MKIIHDDAGLENDSRIEQENKPFRRHGNGNILAGFILVAIGVLLLLRSLQVEIPSWLFRWETLLIAIGLFSGARHNFRHFGWLIPVGIGSFFLLDDIFPEIELDQFAWPVILIGMGIFIMFKPRHHKHYKRFYKGDAFSYGENNGSVTGDDLLDVSAMFGSIKKTVLSKDFKGGKLTCIFGGAKINLMQSDIQGTVILDVSTVMGGTELIVPANWDVKQEMSAVMGGIEDKRPTQHVTIDATKVLVLKGSVVMGGIEIKSY